MNNTFCPQLETNMPWINGDPKRLSADGVQAMYKWAEGLGSAFGPDSWKHATGLEGGHPLSCFNSYEALPLDRKLAAEHLAQLAHSIDVSGQLLGREVYPWQREVVRWLLFQLLSGHNSLLVSAGTGSGKTLVLAALLRAYMQAQRQESTVGPVVVVFNRAHVASQQIMSMENRCRKSMKAQSGGDIKQIIEYCHSVLPKHVCLSRILLQELVTSDAASEEKRIKLSEAVGDLDDPKIVDSILEVILGTRFLILQSGSGKRLELDVPAPSDAPNISSGIFVEPSQAQILTMVPFVRMYVALRCRAFLRGIAIRKCC